MSKREGGGGRPTRRGYGTGESLETDAHPEPSPEPADDAAVEIEHVRESGTPRLLEGRWRAVEVWTTNHIYVLDAWLTCIDVVDRRSGRGVAEHGVVGARLLGGQRAGEGGAIGEVSHPYPRRGDAAVFAEDKGKRVNLSTTSAVTRVVIRQRVVQVGRGDAPPSWKQVTGEDTLP